MNEAPDSITIGGVRYVKETISQIKRFEKEIEQLKKQVSEQVSPMLGLTKQEETVLKMRLEGHSLTQIGRNIQHVNDETKTIGPTRVNQILVKTIRKLSHPSRFWFIQSLDFIKELVVANKFHRDSLIKIHNNRHMKDENVQKAYGYKG